MNEIQHAENDLDGGLLAVDIAQVSNPALVNASIDGRSLIPLVLGTVEDVVVEGDFEVDGLHSVLVGKPLVAVKPVSPPRAKVMGRTGVGTAAPVEAPRAEESVELDRGDVAAELASKDNGTCSARKSNNGHLVTIKRPIKKVSHIPPFLVY